MNLNDFWLNPKTPLITPFSLLFSFGMIWSSVFSGLYSNNKKSWESLYEMIPENKETNIRPEEKGKEEENN